MARWLGDIRTYFPSSVVRVIQHDALARLNLTTLLLEPEMLDAVEPDVHLVGTLLALKDVMPESARETARTVVRHVVNDLERRLAHHTRSTVHGALDRAARTTRPRRVSDIDWDRTIRRNLQHYLPEHRTIVPRPLSATRAAAAACNATSSSPSTSAAPWPSSVVYASVFGAVLASLPDAAHLPRSVRHRCRRPHRPVERPRRRAVRHPTRRRHRHQPGHRLLPRPHHPPRRFDLRAHQ